MKPSRETYRVVDEREKLKRLDAHVARVQELKQSVRENLWDLGAELRAVKESECWKARGTYRTWGQWCATELRISRQQAWRLVTLTVRYERGEYVRLRSLGLRALLAVSVIEGEDRARQIEKLRAGATVDRVAKESIANRTVFATRKGGGRPSGSSRYGILIADADKLLEKVCPGEPMSLEAIALIRRLRVALARTASWTVAPPAPEVSA